MSKHGQLQQTWTVTFLCDAWIKSCFGVFLLAGSLQPDLGGGIVVHNISLEDIQSRVNNDPCVAEKVITAEIPEIKPVKTDERFSFLLE